MLNDDDYSQSFAWKQTLIQHLLEGAATYFSERQVICNKRVLGFINDFSYS